MRNAVLGLIITILLVMVSFDANAAVVVRRGVVVGPHGFVAGRSVMWRRPVAWNRWHHRPLRRAFVAGAAIGAAADGGWGGGCSCAPTWYGPGNQGWGAPGFGGWGSGAGFRPGFGWGAPGFGWHRGWDW